MAAASPCHQLPTNAFLVGIPFARFQNPSFAFGSKISQPGEALESRAVDSRSIRPNFKSRHAFFPWLLWPAGSSTSPGITAIVMSANKGGRDGTAGSPDDEFGMYPWDPAYFSDDSSIEWVQEDIITLFTTDGLIQIGGSKVPRQMSSEKRQARGRGSTKYRRYREDSYMDSKQGLCLGAVFDIAATNGLDLGRRFCVFGFCRSVEMLSDVVEDTVLEQGGEVVAAEKGSSGGLNEKLSMTVAMPLLWGIPPAVDTLNYAIRSGGGIVEKVYWQWEFL